MARIIALDSGPVGLACHDRKNTDVIKLYRWFTHWQVAGAIIILPEIVDYEVRRELLRQKLTDPVAVPDRLRTLLRYVRIREGVLDIAADLWAGLRLRGLPTGSDDSIDADVILAAQAYDFCGLSDDLYVATGNPSHLSRLVSNTCDWKSFWPYDVAGMN